MHKLQGMNLMPEGKHQRVKAKMMKTIDVTKLVSSKSIDVTIDPTFLPHGCSSTNKVCAPKMFPSNLSPVYAAGGAMDNPEVFVEVKHPNFAENFGTLMHSAHSEIY